MALRGIATGLVLLLLVVPRGGYDLIADPVGWLLVLVGVGVLRDSDHRGLLLSTGALAAAVAVVLWFPAVREPLVGGDPALTWAANLPQVGFTVALAWVLRGHATEGGDHRAANWLRTAAVLLGLVGLAPAVVLGGGVTVLAEATYVVAGFALVLLIALLFTYSGRAWVPEEERTG